MLENINNLHNNIANDVWPNGAKLTCKECREIVTITTTSSFDEKIPKLFKYSEV